MLAGELVRRERLGDRADLVGLEDEAVDRLEFVSPADARGVRDGKIVGDNVGARDLTVRLDEAVPVVLIEHVLNEYEIVLLGQALDIGDQLVVCDLAAVEVIGFVLAVVHLGHGAVECKRALFAVAAVVDGLLDQVKADLRILRRGTPAVRAAHARLRAGIRTDDRAEPVEDLNGDLDGLLDVAGAVRHDDELIECLTDAGIHAAVEHVERRDGYGPDPAAGDVIIERTLAACRRRAVARYGHRVDGVAAEVRLVLSAVEFDHAPVDRGLIHRVHTDECRGNDVVDIGDRLMYGQAVVFGGIIVTQDERLVHTNGRTGRRSGRANRAVFGDDVDLDHRPALAVNDLTGMHAADAAALAGLAGQLGHIHDVQVTQVRAGVAGEDCIADGVERFKAGVTAQGVKDVDAFCLRRIIACGIRDAAGDLCRAVGALGVNGQAHAAGRLLSGDGVGQRQLLTRAAVAGDGGIIEDLRRRLTGAQQYARRLDGVAVVLDLAGERGKYGADLSGLALEVRGEDHGRDAHLLGDALGRQAGVRQTVEQKVGVLGEGLGRLALGADVHEIVHNGFRQTVGYTVVTDDLPRFFKRRLVGAHRRTFIIFVRLADIAGGRRAYGIRDAEADEFGAAVADALCEHAAVHGGDVASDRVDLINTGTGFEHDVGRVDLILQ